MHDGSFETLKEVIEYYDNKSICKKSNQYRYTFIRTTTSDSEEKQDLETFPFITHRYKIFK